LAAADGFNCTTHRSVGYVLAIPGEQVLNSVRGCDGYMESINGGPCGQATTPNQCFGDFDRFLGNIELGNSV
jgi:hypothetical protein